MPDEELCIFYGHELWFEQAPSANGEDEIAVVREAGASTSSMTRPIEVVENPFVQGDPDEILSDDEEPFLRTKVMPEEDAEEDESSVRTSEPFHQRCIQ